MKKLTPHVRLATRADKQKVIEIMVDSFWDNPGVNYTIKPDFYKLTRIEALASFAFECGYRKHGVYITDNNLGVMICFEHAKKMNLFSRIWLSLYFIFRVSGLKNLRQTYRHQRAVKMMRHTQEPNLYCWFMGINREGRKDTKNALTLMQFLFDLSQKNNLPILAETTVEKNKRVYERFGFTCYNQMIKTHPHLITWFMRRDIATPKLRKNNWQSAA